LQNIKYIIRKRALGDVLWIEPIISAFAHRGHKIIVHTKYNDLFLNYPFQNVTFKTELNIVEKCLLYVERKIGSRFLAINLNDAYEKNPELHFLTAYQKEAGLSFSKVYPKIYLSESEKREKFIDGKYIVLHLESFSDKKFRQVYGIKWEEVVTYLLTKGYKVVQVGVRNETLAGATEIKTTIRELISLIYNCSYFIGLDSGPSHIAASLGKPALVFFGAVDPNLRHFPELFKGFLMKNACEFDGNQKLLFDKGTRCTRMNSFNQPLCCTYTTAHILSKIDELIHLYVS
jgi:ADP-heptose:LPS heptosyltransferase